jgi:ribose transport system substrate-binding protein
MTAGCGRSESPGSERLQIAAIPKGTTHQFWRNVEAGVKTAGQELNVEIIWQGPQREDDRQLQIQVVQNFVSRGIGGIVLAPLDARSLVRPVEEAVRRNIPVVIIDSALESDAQESFVATNNYEGGRMGARRLAEVIGTGRRIILLRYQEGSASTTARENGFLDGISEYLPDAELVSTRQYAGATLEKALQASQNLLNRFPEVEGVFCANESSTQGMLRALQTAGRAGEVKLVGFDMNPTLQEAIRNGEIHGLAVQDPFQIGYLGVKTIVSVIRGEPVESRIDTRLIMVTSQNVDDPSVQSVLFPDLSVLE